MIRHTTFFLFLVLTPILASGQAISLTVFPQGIPDSSPEEPEYAVLGDVIAAFRNTLELRGWLGSDETGRQVYIAAREATESGQNMLMLSISLGSRMTAATVEAGTENQIWYAGKPEPENPAEARFVREYMTKEALENMVHIYSTDLLLFPKNQLDMQVNEYLDQMLARQYCMRSTDC